MLMECGYLAGCAPDSFPGTRALKSGASGCMGPPRVERTGAQDLSPRPGRGDLW